MKTKSIRGLATVFLTLFLVCICLATIFAFPVSAVVATNKEERKTDYKTTDPKPTYTATLNENNKLLNELTKKENRLLKKIKDDGKDWVSDGFALAKAIKNSSDDTDWEKMGVEATKKLLNSLPGAWSILGAVFEGFESLTSSGQAPLSEIQVLSDDIDKRFNAISDQLYDIEEELGALSNQVTSTANDVLSGTQTQINNLEAKQVLRSFMSSGEGNFSYLEFSNYLYGIDSTYVNASEAYYILLLEAIATGADDELIEYYYNRLFDSLYSNIHIYNQYYYGDIAGLDKSMAAYYYDYLSYNSTLVDAGTTAEYQALLFALDLYTTYAYSYEILEMCFAYQATDMYLKASLAGRDILDNDAYEYADGKLIKYSTIEDELKNMKSNLVLAEEQVVKDIAYILGMMDSYIAVDKNGDIHNIGNYGESFGNITDEQTIYLNVISDDICDLFELNTDNFRYYVNDVEYIGRTKAIIDANEVYNDTFTASVTYGNTEIYSIEFIKIDNLLIEEFSGGSGTQEDPYLISNAVQFYMVEDDLSACYQLISDIAVTGTHSPIGTEKKPFNGIFDGNGYSITNLNIESLPYDNTNITLTPTTGMFGTIGRNGVVKNLTLNAIQVSSEYQQDSIKPESDISYYCIGGIAGINRGVISNCTIRDNSNIVVNRLKQIQDSRTVEIYVGGIVGNNSGVIEYCSTDDLAITADSYLYYYNESTSKNQHSVYMGGIAAITSDTIQCCRVSSNTTLSAYAKSIADSEDREKPILSVYVGGIIADDSSIIYLSNVYSDCNIVKCKGEIYNEGTYLGAHRYSWDKVSLKEGLYYPTFFPLSASEKIDDFEMHFYESEYQKIFNENYREKCDEIENQEGSRRQLSNDEYQLVVDESKAETKQALIEKKNKANLDALTALNGKIISTYNDTAFKPNNDKLDITIELTENICDINAKYLTDYIKKYLNEKDEIVGVSAVDENGKSICATIVGYYGFNTYHEYSTGQTITVKVFFYVEDVLLSDDVVLTIKGKELVKWEIKDFIDTPIKKDSNVESCLETIFEHGFKIVYTFSNGQIEEYIINAENKDDVIISNFSTTEAGEKELEIIHLKQPAVGSILNFKENVFVKCPHTDIDFEHISTVPATCSLLGYEIWECQLCGETVNKNYKKGFHDYIISDEVKATCHEAGYTQEVSCSVCGKIFESSEWIQALPHNYVSSSEVGYKPNGLYSTAEYHYCTNGDHYEAHQYTVSEYVDENGTLVYLYSCFCGYKNPVPDYNIKTKENGEKPVVVVTNGHVLNVGDEVVIYVQIINNPGFKGATFGIRYDNGLELISADESMIVPQQLKVRNEVYNGYNFLWAEGDGNKTTEDGYLLKLTFRYIDESESEQQISVVYGMSNGSEGGFCTLDDSYHMFMTQSGTISVVEHLPGDVNNDEVVDIMDATYIAWSIVGKEDGNGNKIQVNARYADVNLDGKVDLLDVLAILQSVSGRYGTSLLSSDYKLFFNLNGFICDDVDESVMVEFYDENGNRTKWSENVDFAKYEALMKQLGYSFVGWYTRMDCTCAGTCIHIVKASDFITYDKYQGNQTLYARWAKNRIVFDISGCDADPIDDILYGSKYEDNSIITLPELTWSYGVTCIAFGTEENTKYTGRVYRTFIGWEDENGNIITQIDILQPGLGVVNLKAKWSEDYVWDAPVFAVNGYEIRDWYLDAYYTEAITEDTSWEDFVSALEQNNFYVYSKKIATKYTISYENTKGAVNSNLSEYTIESPKIVLSDIIVEGYAFDGWYNGDEKITEIPKYSYGDVVLTARWTLIAYTITYENIKDASNPNQQNTYTIEDTVSFENLPDIKGYIFKGWYTAENGGTEITSIEKGCIGNKVYYAQWTPIVYAITYKNTKGVINSNNPTTYTIEDEVNFNALADVAGYAFNGWYTEDGTKVSSIDRGTTENKTYYARWTKDGYSIKYYNVDGAQIPNIVYSYTIETDTFNIEDAQKDGYSFEGWYSDSNLTIPLDTTIEMGSTGEINCYAKWEAIEYTISYNLNGGSTSESNIGKYTIESGPIPVKNPYKDGYRFIGWSGTGLDGVTENLVIYKGSTGNRTYEAEYEAIVYSITYKYEVIRDVISYPLEDVINAATNPLSYTIETATIKLGDPTKNGYTFIGWSEGSEIPNGSTTDKTFTAKFKPTLYTITFDFAGGIGNGKYPTSYTIESEDITVENPTREGYTFAGWIGTTDFEDPVPAVMILKKSTGDRSYTATWAGIECSIKYDLNETINSEEQDSGMSYLEATRKDQSNKDKSQDDKITYGTIDTLLDIAQASYYKFEGWYTAKTGGVQITDGNGKVINATQFITNTTTLYAHWSKTEKTERGETYIYVKTEADLKRIGESGNYLIVRDINMQGSTWTPKESFSGEINGDGHCIYNFSITKTGGSGSATIAFITKNTGTIKDFIIGKITEDGTYSVKYDVSYKESGSKSSLVVGGFVGENSGTITGCKLINTYINATFADNDNNEHLYLYVGGIATLNLGTISNCHVEGSNIDANATCSKENSGDNNYAWLGGICGKNSGTLSQCTVKTTTLDLDVRGDGYFKLFDNNDAYPWGAVGVIVGEQLDKGTTISSTVSGNTVKTYGSKGDYTHPSIYYNNKEYTSKENTFTDNAKCGKNTGGGTVS